MQSSLSLSPNQSGTIHKESPVFWNSTMRYIFTLLLLISLSVPCIFAREAHSNSLPHHDFALIIPSSQDDYSSVLKRLLDDIIEYLDASHILPQGYPKACAITTSPSEDNPSIHVISCVPITTENGKANGILLDQEGHFIQFSILTYPDTRVYLFEIYLFERLPKRLQHTSQENSVRIGVHLPWLEDTMYEKLFPALEEAIIRAGAQKIFFEETAQKQFTDE